MSTTNQLSPTQLNLALILRESARRFPHRIAVVDRAARYHYRQLWELTLARALLLREELGLRAGDRVAIVAPNGVGFIIDYFAILAAGGVVVPIAPMLVADEVEWQLRDASVHAVLADAEFAEVAFEAAARVDIPGRLLAEPSSLTVPEEATPAFGMVARNPLDPAVVFYTSGTTGRPKGAVLTHLNLVMNSFVNAFTANEFERDDVVLGCLPLFHIFGQTVSMNASFLLGATLVLQRRFEATAALELMRAHSVTVMIGVPTMYMALLAALGDEAPVALRMCVSGGAALPVSVLEDFEGAFGCHIREGYGLSETSPTATVNQPLFGLRPGSIGHPLWGVDVEIASADVEDRVELVGVDSRGEIVIRGHNVFAGYLDKPDATRAAVVDGWFRTGDLGVKDHDGFIHIVDRKKDMIIRGGYNVYPREVEEVLVRHPAVAQVAVLGIPDERLGEEVLAVIVLGDVRRRPTADEMLEWSRERIAAHKRPRIVRFVERLPLGPSGKVLKREIQAHFARERL